jgi:drug/metabolite transporter (DMT)-like permease
MNKILDLRFVIGVFFTIVGLLLIGYSVMNDNESSRTINQWCGIVFTAFGVLMIVLSFLKDANDEILSED